MLSRSINLYRFSGQRVNGQAKNLSSKKSQKKTNDYGRSNYSRRGGQVFLTLAGEGYNITQLLEMMVLVFIIDQCARFKLKTNFGALFELTLGSKVKCLELI